MKLVNNLLAGTVGAATIEALLLGVKAGLTPELMLSVFATTAANNGTLEPLIRGRVLKREIESPVFALNLQYKDARLALELASDVEAAMPCRRWSSSFARRCVRRAEAAGTRRRS